MITESQFRRFVLLMIIFLILAVNYFSFIDKEQMKHMPKPESIPERTSYGYAP